MTYRVPDRDIIAKDVEAVAACDLPWERLAGKTIAVVGATSMLAGHIVDALLALTRLRGAGPAKVIAAARNMDKASARFAHHADDPALEIVPVDAAADIDPETFRGVHIMVHAASIARPRPPAPTSTSWRRTCWELGGCSISHATCRDSSSSSISVPASPTARTSSPRSRSPEEMYFPTSCLSPTSCYTESKRAGESIAKAFMDQYGVPVKIIRHFGTYGPGMDLDNDPRAFTSFVKRVVDGQDIVLHSTGEETRFWCYIADATEGLLPRPVRRRVRRRVERRQRPGGDRRSTNSPRRSRARTRAASPASPSIPVRCRKATPPSSRTKSRYPTSASCGASVSILRWASTKACGGRSGPMRSDGAAMRLQRERRKLLDQGTLKTDVSRKLYDAYYHLSVRLRGRPAELECSGNRHHG